MYNRIALCNEKFILLFILDEINYTIKSSRFEYIVCIYFSFLKFNFILESY